MDEMPIIPIYYYTQIKAVNPKLKMLSFTIGANIFDKAYIE